ncbi:hypothetical protein [Rufibacter hautae]|nr:hypothetical protein [Rufibacter hautae]
MKGQLLTHEPHVTIWYNVVNDTPSADWLGEQTEETCATATRNP